MRAPRWPRNPWVFALLAGSAIGLVTLGAGGRYAMRLAALDSGRVPEWTVEGTLTVLFFGTWIGGAGALIRAAAARWLPTRAPEAVRTLLFAVACLLLGLRGLSPFTARTLALFMPVIAAYAVAVELAWRGRTAAPRGEEHRRAAMPRDAA